MHNLAALSDESSHTDEAERSGQRGTGRQRLQRDIASDGGRCASGADRPSVPTGPRTATPGLAHELAVVWQADTDGSGLLEFDEFVQLVRGMNPKQENDTLGAAEQETEEGSTDEPTGLTSFFKAVSINEVLVKKKKPEGFFATPITEMETEPMEAASFFDFHDPQAKLRKDAEQRNTSAQLNQL